MIIMRLNKCRTAAAVGLCLLALSGRSQLSKYVGNEESVDYKSTVAMGDPLSIPPDLPQATRDPPYRAPAGPATYRKYEQHQPVATSQADTKVVLPTTPRCQENENDPCRTN